jgi:hypothetical protein
MATGCLEGLLRCTRCLGLRLVVVEDDRAVLGTDVRPLAVELGRVVVGEEHIEQLLIADLGGIVLDLNHLGVAGAAGAHLLV